MTRNSIKSPAKEKKMERKKYDHQSELIKDLSVSSRLGVRLPGIDHEKKREETMEIAIKNAVAVMKGEKNMIEFLKDGENIKLIIDRAKSRYSRDELIRMDKELLEENIVQEIKHIFMKEEITARDICDYVLGNAHHNYREMDKKYQPVKGPFGGTAKETCHFGTPRELASAMETPFSGEYKINPYAGYAQRALESLKDPYCIDGYMTAPLSMLKENGEAYDFQNNTEEIVKMNKTVSGCRWPTDEKLLDKIRNHIDSIYKCIIQRKETLTRKKADILIAQIHRRFAQAMPYTRGSAAIGDCFVKALYDFLDIHVTPYKEGISPDLEAFVSSLPTFVKNYSSFFEDKVS